MLRTDVYLYGDAAVSCIIAKSGGKLDVNVYNDPDASQQDMEDVHIETMLSES